MVPHGTAADRSGDLPFGQAGELPDLQHEAREAGTLGRSCRDEHGDEERAFRRSHEHAIGGSGGQYRIQR